MNFELLLIISILILSGLFFGWVYSETKLEGKFNKIINWISFPFPLLALYAIFKLNLDFGYVLVSLTALALLVWVTSAFFNFHSLKKEGRSFFTILFLITIFRSFIFEPFQIPSESMLPQLEIGDFLVVNKYSYGLKNPIGNKTLFNIGSPQRGDVIVFTPKHTVCSSNLKSAYPDSLDLLSNQQRFNWQRYYESCTELGVKYIKRVVGVPGDEVVYQNKNFFINGMPLKKKFMNQESNEFIFEETQASKDYLVRQTDKIRNLNNSWKVPEGHYFVSGDNRDNSLDSRSWGFVSEEDVSGKASFIWMHWECLGCLPKFSRNKFIK